MMQAASRVSKLSGLARYDEAMNENYLAIEIFFQALVVIAGLGMAGFAGLVVKRLFQGQK